MLDSPGRLIQDGPESAEKGKTMRISKTRGLLYLIARLLGDLQAVRRGRVGRRVARRAAGRLTGRGLGRLFRR